VARASQVTKLSLDRWAQIMGLNPLHFNGLYVPGFEKAYCGEPWMQYEWQTPDRVSREEVARAIAEAEMTLERYLGFRLLPTWEIDEWHTTQRAPSPELIRAVPVDVSGHPQGVRASWGYVISGGIRSKSLVQGGAPVTYTDEDNDNYSETATVTVNATFNKCEIHVFFPNKGYADEYEIRPIKVTSSGNTVTITFRREQAVDPDLQEDILPAAGDDAIRGLNAQDSANFVATVDVVRVYNDPQQQVTFMWAPFGSCTDCGGSGCQVCAYATQTGCISTIANPRLSVINYQPATWNSSTLTMDPQPWALPRQPTLVRLYYYAGWRNRTLPCPTTSMDPEWERVVAYYAASLLDRPICGCNNISEFVKRWQYDYAVSGPENTVTAPKDVDNPFGSTRGAIRAWRAVNREGAAIGRGVVV